jgi:hypothetical protein
LHPCRISLERTPIPDQNPLRPAASATGSGAGEKLAGWADSAPMRIALDTPLALAAPGNNTASVKITIRQLQSTSPIALWQTNVDPTLKVAVNGKLAATAPMVTLIDLPDPGMVAVKMAYDGPDMAIYELPYPKPYFETRNSECKLNPVNRETLDVRCPAATELLRREAFYPGWSASVDDKSWPIERSREIFQSIALPAGLHRVVYTYRPSYWRLILSGFVAGLLMLLFEGWRELKEHCLLRPAPAPAP